MKTDVILGLQWGDEGKGKIVDFLTPRYDVIARFQGGPNAGHTIEFEGEKFILHTIPSGIFNADKINLIGNGVIIDPFILKQEITNLESNNIEVGSHLYVSRRAHLILPTHRLLDATYETIRGSRKIGSTLKGIGPAYSDKIGRKGIRVGDIHTAQFLDKYHALKEDHLNIIRFHRFDFSDHMVDGIPFMEYEEQWLQAVDLLGSLNIVDSEYFINEQLDSGKSVLAEGAQGTLLDIDFGSYPFVTSSNTMIGGVVSGLGISPKNIGKVMGIFKAYCTRVGSGPFPSEQDNADGEKMRQDGREFGSTTGRPRRCGWLDLVALKYSIMISGVDSLLMMKTDVLNEFDTIKAGESYIINGVEKSSVPFDFQSGDLAIKYREFPGWKSSLDGIKSKDNVPNELRDYIRYIEKYTGIPVELFSYGPDRNQTCFLK
jgi:adenylosuccinate synthase